jgi:predicted lipoprotein with Yx(FWY)xxD motif
MNMPRRLSAIAIAAVLLVAGCASGGQRSDDAQGGSTTAAATTSSPSPTPGNSTPPEMTGTTITTGDSDFGQMLFDSRGQAIYIWEVEDSSKAQCYDDCAEAWPPVLTEGAPVGDGAVDADMLGTTAREDGTTQVTYNDHPLYFYAHEAPGEVKCHNIATHGGLWWVVQPDGNRAP